MIRDRLDTLPYFAGGVGWGGSEDTSALNPGISKHNIAGCGVPENTEEAKWETVGGGDCQCPPAVSKHMSQELRKKKKSRFFFPKQWPWKNLLRLFFQKALRMQLPGASVNHELNMNSTWIKENSPWVVSFSFCAWVLWWANLFQNKHNCITDYKIKSRFFISLLWISMI